MKRMISIACLAVVLVGMLALGLMSPSAPVATTTAADSTGTVFMPAVAEWHHFCRQRRRRRRHNATRRAAGASLHSRWPTRTTMPSLLAGGNQGQGKTIAVIDSWGSDTIAHDLHVFNQAFGLQPMCGEEGVTCAAGMPTFAVLSLQGSPATKAPAAQSNGTGLEDKSAWALEVSLDVQWAHATAPKANILLVTTPTAETLGVQGFPQMMNALQYIVDNHLADVVSMSFGAGEGTFHSGSAALMQLRQPIIDAQANGVTLFASSGDGGSTNSMKEPVKNPATIPYPSVDLAGSDPLVTAVGGTYLCTDAVDGLSVDTTNPPSGCRPALNPGFKGRPAG